ncbi:MAG: hypothetical protein IJ693_08675 [Bacteroidaceae bacterium]|nr:hypothetical protein [Bacteroidaceae bacterium]
MPFNLLKRYNQTLDLLPFNEKERILSLKGVFNRDIVQNSNFCFRSKKIFPTTAEGQDAMERLFSHLTTIVVEKETQKREYDADRSIRLHWIKYHIEENKKDEMYVFSVQEPQGIRTYIYDKVENYVIVLEPMRNGKGYYLLTAYYMKGKDAARNKMMRKYKRKLDSLL